MATPTSSNNRSKRKTNKPITQGQNPQRANRQKVSNAKVTNSTQRTNNGTAKVTTGKGGSTPKALPPGAKSGALATQGRGSLRGQPQLPPGRKGGGMEKAGPTVDVKANTPKVSGASPKTSAAAPKALPAGRSGGQLTRAVRGAASAASKMGPLAKAAGVAGSALAVADQLGRVLNPKDNILTRAGSAGRRIEGLVGGGGGGNATPGERAARLNAQRGQYAGPGGKPDGSGKGQERQTTPRVNKVRQDQMRAALNNDYPLSTASQRRGSAQSGGGSTQSRGSSPAPAAPRRQPGLAADAGMKNQDKNYRGNLFEKTFGYKPGQAPDQQKSRFKSVDNKFGQDSGYEPKTKVDGSKYADKKPDMKKVKEYDRLRRKYYD